MREAFKSLFTPINRTMRSVGGGISIPPGMKLGMNVAWINSWSGAWVFSNLMYHATLPVKVTGTGDWTHNQGLIQASTPTDTFRFVLADNGDKLPAGDYTVLNPDALKISISGFNAPSQGSYTTATQFTFNHDAVSSSALCLHVEGNVTADNGNLAVILPGHLAAWNAGNVWNQQFLDFYTALKLPVLRFMDWTWASQNIETEWADRPNPNGITFRTPWANNDACVPYEYICDIAGRLNVDVWVCSPVRASVDYIQQMATLFAANLPIGRKIWLEHANEVWNSAIPWGEGTAWATRLDHTKRLATCDVANQKFVLTSHGMTDGTRIVCQSTVENRASRTTVNWQFGTGVSVYVKSVDADSFEVYSEVGLTTKIIPSAGTVNLLFSSDAEPGKVDDLNGHYAETCLRNWNIFDSIMGQSRVFRLLAAQAGNSATTTQRLQVAGVPERTSAVAIAPYYSGTWFGGSVDCADGQLTPRFWASDSNTVHMAVYASGATPTAAQVIAGTGAINKQTLSYSAGPNTYTAGVAVTGLVNDTSYSVHFVYVDTMGSWAFSVEATPAVAPSTVYAYDSHENQAIRNRLAIVKSVGEVATHKAIAGSIPVLCYEGGLHFHHSSPTQMSTWIRGYQETALFGDVTRRYLVEIASSQATALCYYGDSLSTTFSIAEGFHDTSDVRYLAFKNRAGRVRPAVGPVFNSGLIPSITTEPEYPFSWFDLGEPTYTYEIVSGNEQGNYSVVNGTLQLVSGSGINWSSPTLVNLKIRASNNEFTRTFSVSFSTGTAWYEADALFAWSPVADLDTAAINPIIGNVLPLVEGTGVTVSDNMWDLGLTARFGANNALISPVLGSKPILWASVLDRDDHAANFRFIWRQGVGNFMGAYVSSSTSTDFRMNSNIGGQNLPSTQKFAATTPTGKHVYWIFYDPATGQVHTGYDQVANGSVSAPQIIPSTSITTDLYIGGVHTSGLASNMRHGAMQIVNRTGLELAQAMDIVAKMQAHHNIT